MVSQSLPDKPKPKMPSFQHLSISSPAPGVCHCALDRPPVNALNSALWTELLQLLTHLETLAFPSSTRVLLITSANPGPIFAAGHDLLEMYVPKTSEHRFRHFWYISASFLSRLYSTPLQTIVALHGTTPAAACALALCCDYRLALQDTTIGLNEVAIGLSVPPFWARLYIRTSKSSPEAERELASGRLLPAQDAHHLGLVDGITNGSRDDLMRDAMRLASQWAARPGCLGRAETKFSIRSDFASDWLDYSNEEARSAWRQLSRPSTIQALGGLLRSTSERPQSARM